MLSLKAEIGACGCRTRRMAVGKEDVVGVAGRTFTEWWGERAINGVLVTPSEAAEDVDDALE